MIGLRIRRIRKAKGMSINKLSALSNVALGYLSNIENEKVPAPTGRTLENIAEALGVSVLRLEGKSVNSKIEQLMAKKGETYETLSDKVGIAAENIEKLDTYIPCESDYEVLERVAQVLGVDSRILTARLALQEPPIYDGEQTDPAEEFDDGFIETIAAHHDSENWTEEELEEIEKFKDFVKSKRKE